jgi:succinate-semialdehyde dehydrogenase/glutarate-semialdehyde dehydrogenase
MQNPTGPLALLKDPSLLKTDALINGNGSRAGSAALTCWTPAPAPNWPTWPTWAQKMPKRQLPPPTPPGRPGAARPRKERSIILRKWFDLLMANQEDLGRIMTAEQGKPFAEAKGEVAYGASFVEWYAEEAKRVNGETLPQFDNNRRLMVLAPAHRRVRGHHAVELPAGHDHAQGGTGAGRWLPGGHQARRADAADGAGRRRAGHARRHSQRAC